MQSPPHEFAQLPAAAHDIQEVHPVQSPPQVFAQLPAAAQEIQSLLHPPHISIGVSDLFIFFFPDHLLIVFEYVLPERQDPLH